MGIIKCSVTWSPTVQPKRTRHELLLTIVTSQSCRWKLPLSRKLRRRGACTWGHVFIIQFILQSYLFLATGAPLMSEIRRFFLYWKTDLDSVGEMRNWKTWSERNDFRKLAIKPAQWRHTEPQGFVPQQQHRMIFTREPTIFPIL